MAAPPPTATSSPSLCWRGPEGGGAPRRKLLRSAAIFLATPFLARAQTAPRVVVVGGGVSAAGELLLAPARDVVAARALSPSRDVVKIVSARFGAESGMLGAAALAWDEVGGDG